MPRCLLVAELASNHGGDMALAVDLLGRCVDAGADIIKTQGYQVKHLRRSDPQYTWLAQAELSESQHLFLKQAVESEGAQYLSTAFTVDDLSRLHKIGLKAVKIGSGEARSELVDAAAGLFSRVYCSLPWGRGEPYTRHTTWLATVPLYPAPVECYSRVHQQNGYSDHHVGLSVAKLAIAQGAQVLEKHVSIPGKGRNSPWDCTPEDFRELRLWAELVAQATSGTKWEGRWIHPTKTA